MSNPSEALNALIRKVENLPGDEPVTWHALHEVLQDAAKAQAYGEWETYMGDDL